MTNTLLRLLAGALSTGAIAVAQPPAAAAARPPSACSAAEMHQFDFWIGDWEVRNDKNQLMGTNIVSPVVEGCALHEAWAAQGEVGESFSIYDPTTRHWHQTWVDNKANLWMIDGGMQGSSMVMTRSAPAKADPKITVLHRWTWTPSDKDHVRQLYEASRDGGKTWTVMFDGRYIRRKT